MYLWRIVDCLDVQFALCLKIYKNVFKILEFAKFTYFIKVSRSITLIYEMRCFSNDWYLITIFIKLIEYLSCIFIHFLVSLMHLILVFFVFKSYDMCKIPFFTKKLQKLILNLTYFVDIMSVISYLYSIIDLAIYKYINLFK
jgi:hypothetical protein